MRAAFSQQQGKGYMFFSEKRGGGGSRSSCTFQKRIRDDQPDQTARKAELRRSAGLKAHFFVDPRVDSSASTRLDPGKVPADAVDGLGPTATATISRSQKPIPGFNKLNYNIRNNRRARPDASWGMTRPEAFLYNY